MISSFPPNHFEYRPEDQRVRAVERVKNFDRRLEATGTCLLQALETELPIKPNPRGVPSLWYMPLVGGENFFDGFGFQLPAYQRRYGWKGTPIDERERRRPPARPLLPFLEQLNRRLPQKWDNKRKTYVRNDDWLLWNIQPDGTVEEPHKAKR